ncbi:HAMP domain-containing sensor histidine kinase [Saccharibacillus kuerlensis]|uniref:histidine kinase n=1 Tax=Saccharibacillus kuerlensis TaxID=459527 RepID=A0ABQ2L8D1_9BACL|nr:ATP-binding protein [Saccharibacillus kuerlensis]GGO05489.1 sensor histidine kinase YkoH [Saccharibacillus kuerlensis]
MRLKSKIYLYTSVLFAILLTAVCISVYMLFGRMAIGDETRRIEAEALLIADRVASSASEIAPDDLLRAYVPADGMLRVVRPDGTSLPAVTNGDGDPFITEAYEYREDLNNEHLSGGGHGYIRVSVPVIWSDGEVRSVQISRSIADTEGRLAVLRTVLALVALLAMVPAILASGVLANRIIRPISALTGTMSDIRQSGTFRQIETGQKPGDELAEMERTFNEMIALLETNFERQERFVSDASHELKTPLTIIESYANLLRRRGRERPEVFDEAVDAILSESVRMRELTERLLQSARRPEADTLQLTEADLAKCVRESASVISKAYGRKVEVESAEFVTVTTDEAKVRQLLFILLDNARKYSEEKIEVETLGGKGLPAVIRVKDRGVGIPEAELPKVFDRFYRVDSSRTRQTGGSGLGLSLAKDIADVLNIAIRIDSEVGRGTTVTLTFAPEGIPPRVSEKEAGRYGLLRRSARHDGRLEQRKEEEE